jgi:trigger factor
VKTTVEPLEGNKVKLSVEVDESEFDKALDSAFRAIAREVRIPGFRPGKAPRRILEARLGPDAAREEALRQAIPEYYVRAVREHDVDPIAPPEIDITAGESGGQVAFDAVVEVRPTVAVPGYAGLRVELPSPVPTDEEIDNRLEVLRTQDAELVDVDRPAADEDFVVIDIAGSLDDEPIPGLTADGYVYRVGSGAVVPELDTELTGASAGDELSFSATHPAADEDDGPIDFVVTVQQVQERKLPDLTDEWAAKSSEFATVDELRGDVTRRLRLVRGMQAQMALRERVANAVADLVTDELPEALVAAETRNRIQDLVMRLQAQGMGVEQYLEATGKDQLEFTEEIKSAATQAVRADLALRAVAEAEALEVSDDEVDDEIANVAQRSQQKPAAVRRQLERNDAIPAVRSDIRTRKALEWLVEHAEIVDPDGKPIDRADLAPPADLAPATTTEVEPDSTETTE